MSWVGDITENLLVALKNDGRVKDAGVKDRSVRKGLTEDFPQDIARNDFPVIRAIWTGTNEEDTPVDVRPERYVTLNFSLFLAVYEMDYEKRYDDLADLCEIIADAIYSVEDTGFVNLDLDEINIRSIDVAPDVLTDQGYAVAIMDVGITAYTARKDRQGK